MFESGETVHSLAAQVAAWCAALDPETLPPAHVGGVHAAVAQMVKALTGAELRLARRVEACRVWEGSGSADAPEYLARRCGTSIAAARRALVTSRRAAQVPAVDEALARGRLSGPQAEAIADAAAVAPAAAPELVGSAAEMSLGELRELCGRAKAKVEDLEAKERRLRAGRSWRSWTDAEGRWHGHLTGTIADGARIEAAVAEAVDRLVKAAKADPAPAGEREPYEAVAFDAVLGLLTGPATTAVARRPIRHLTLVRIDGAQVSADDGEPTCEVAGLGPISTAAAVDLLGESVLGIVLTKGQQVVNVTYLGRNLNAAQQLAQRWALPKCSTLGCPRRVRLENDHREPWADTHVTTLEGNDPACRHCHALKTHRGWAYVAGEGPRALVPPEDPRHPRWSRANAPPSAAR